MPKDQQNLVRRSPVVVVMGHIDHGKSTLLDYIRKANIVSGEAGGITQHVGAYEAISQNAAGEKHLITFLDTPGHEAFCSIRERGALAADIAILVVSAEDGVKPQTVEAFREIKAAGIPFIVAINKIDKPNADIDRTKTSLGEHEIYVEGWGGDVPWVAISAIQGTGVPELLEMIQLVADMADLKTSTEALASGAVIESELDTRKGITVTLLIKNGSVSDTVQFDTVKNVWYRGRQSSTGAPATSQFTIELTSGRKTVIEATNFQREKDLAATLFKRLTAVLTAKAALDLQAGKRLSFGTIQIDRNGVSNGRETIPWNEVGDVRVSGGSITITRQGKWGAWAQVSTELIPNVLVLLMIADAIKGVQIP